MARFKVTHSQDACRIDIKGDRRNPEPTMACIAFPGGDVEVSRHSNGRDYWVHVRVADPTNITESRMDFTHEEYRRRKDAGEKTIPDIPDIDKMNHMAFLVSGKVLDHTGE